MMKKLLVIVITVVMMSYPPLPAYAYSAETIADASDLLEVKDGTIVSKSTDEEHFWEAYGHAVISTLNACDATEAGKVQWIRNADGYRFFISAQQIKTLIAHQEYADRWIADTVPSIIPQGMERQDAILTIYHWILNHYSYSYDISSNDDTAEKYQGVYPMLVSPQLGGICSSYSKLFRAMIESIPFNQMELVDYQTDNPTHLTVDIINNAERTHEWNAITEPDGVRLYYDLSSQAIEPESLQSNSGAPFYYRLSEAELSRIPIYGNPQSFCVNQ
jgi:hypothetical protein